MGDKVRYILTEIFLFLTNKQFLLNLLGMVAFVAFVIWGVLTWLKIYTHHGQQLQLPNYIGMHIDKAMQDAQDKTFEIVVNDSVHIVGKPGGTIFNQNPIGGSLVKENRKIYVTTTKYNADIVDLTGMVLYGQSYELKKAALERKGLITKIRDYRYEALTHNSILEMWQGNKLLISRNKDTKGLKLEKGSTVELILSTPNSQTVVPNLIDKTVSAARFMTPNLHLDIRYAGDLGIHDEDEAIIISQSPTANTSLSNGSTIQVVVKAPDNN